MKGAIRTLHLQRLVRRWRTPNDVLRMAPRKALMLATGVSTIRSIFPCIESAVRRDDYIRHSKQHMIRHEIAQVVLIAKRSSR